MATTAEMVRYYGYYRNVSRGKRRKQDQDEWIPCILEPIELSQVYRKNRARLIQKIYEVDPLTCPKCQGKMRIIAFIEDEEVTRLSCLFMTCNGYKPWQMKRWISLVIEICPSSSFPTSKCLPLIDLISA